MADFHVRSDSVDVEQIMQQIRARIREKRGVDYTEAELQHLASLKLEKFLDPKGVRSTLVEAFRKVRVVSPDPPEYERPTVTELFDSPRAALRSIRRVFNPILRLFINPDRYGQSIDNAFIAQQKVNTDYHRRFRAREEMDPLYYEVIHNLVVEITRLGIEVQNLKMRVESQSSRLDFDERRARAFEGIVHERRGPEPLPAAAESTAIATATATEAGVPPDASGPASAGGTSSLPGPRTEAQRERRRRRRRRRRRPGQTLATTAGNGPAGTGPFPAGSGAARPEAGHRQAGGGREEAPGSLDSDRPGGDDPWPAGDDVIDDDPENGEDPEDSPL